MSALKVHRDLKKVHLHPGGFFMTDEQVVISTILGSCISVCIFDPAEKRGALCHAVLPNAPADLDGNPLRYCDEAIIYLVERFRRIGASKSRLEIKVFGGADVLDTRPREGYSSIGMQNSMAAVETLGWLGLKPSVLETGGRRGRKLMFVPHTGETFVKRIGRVFG